ncbi:hypothetical protein R3W88_033649 [Solanum pinnatisectum]|uniref:Uncharacterized protein n=1 Tax=Solanum pinnatisectum TaxID=50273 RepID=A0AAV9K0F3_9SOLN|nr:hypothetical protein R3W88_033649 [Solanum pinnatisectum]
MCRTTNKYKKLTDTTSYSELDFESSSDDLRKNQKKILRTSSPEKEEWEKEIEDLFFEMNMCVLESHIGLQIHQFCRCRVDN